MEEFISRSRSFYFEGKSAACAPNSVSRRSTSNENGPLFDLAQRLGGCGFFAAGPGASFSLAFGNPP
jgi:hypothetical protein